LRGRACRAGIDCGGFSAKSIVLCARVGTKGEIEWLVADRILAEGGCGQPLAWPRAEEMTCLNVIDTNGYNPEVAGQQLKLKEGSTSSPSPMSSGAFPASIRAALDRSQG
jgi:hypothetical protein